MLLKRSGPVDWPSQELDERDPGNSAGARRTRAVLYSMVDNLFLDPVTSCSDNCSFHHSEPYYVIEYSTSRLYALALCVLLFGVSGTEGSVDKALRLSFLCAYASGKR
jgi:hypothetical protein